MAIYIDAHMKRVLKTEELAIYRTNSTNCTNRTNRTKLSLEEYVKNTAPAQSSKDPNYTTSAR